MQKKTYQNLKSIADQAALAFSDPKRTHNPNKETFVVKDIFPMSDATASVVFKKNTGKVAVAFFYLRKGGAGEKWFYFFPTDEHLLGMVSFHWYKLWAEALNRKHNE